MKSLIKTYSYNAKGCIKKEEIDLVVYADSLKFYITGKEKDYEKILQ